MQENIDRLTSVFRKVFNNTNININRSTTSSDIDQWDSITHLELITATEEEFGIEITGFDVMGLNDVGDLLDLIQRKQEA